MLENKTISTIFDNAWAYEVVAVGLCLAWLFFRQIKRSASLAQPRRWLLIICSVQLFGFLVYAWLLWRYAQNAPHPELYFHPYSQAYLDRLGEYGTMILSGWLAAAILIGLLIWAFIKRGRGVMIDGGDIVLIGLGAVAVGWPAVLVFLGITFVLSVLGLTVQIFMKRKTLRDRLVITDFILPAAILTLIFRIQLLELTGLFKIRF